MTTTELIYILDSNAGKIFSYNSRFKLVRSWQPFGSGVIPDEWEPLLTDLTVTCTSQIRTATGLSRPQRTGMPLWRFARRRDGAGRKLSAELTVANKHVFAMDGDGRTLYVWSTDGKPTLDVDLAPELGQANRYPPALAVNAKGELLVLDDRESRVLRYKINF